MVPLAYRTMSAGWNLEIGAGPGELVVVDLDPGPLWLEVIRQLWTDGAAVLPLDRRLRAAERRAILDRARPTFILDEQGPTLFAGGTAVDPGIGAVAATSGSGGFPKLAELPREALVSSVRGSASMLGATPSDPWVSCLTPAHIGGLSVLLRNVVLGVPVLVHERFDPSRLLAEAPDGAFVSLVPTMLTRLLEQPGDLSHFGALLVGGGPLDASVLEEARERGARVVTSYGLTETCGGIAHDGRVSAGTDVRIDASEGRIELRGPTLMEGYRSDPAATAGAFTLDGWLRTGDVGQVDDGVLSVEGRLDEVIRTGAESVWPQEVERALRDHPKVADVAVAGRPHPEWREQVVAFVVPREAADPPTLQELRAHASERIAGFKSPRDLVLLSELPRTASGKIRRPELPA
jgi:O-succinylbenzoic acid--CoA ligase